MAAVTAGALAAITVAATVAATAAATAADMAAATAAATSTQDGDPPIAGHTRQRVRPAPSEGPEQNAVHPGAVGAYQISYAATQSGDAGHYRKRHAYRTGQTPQLITPAVRFVKARNYPTGYHKPNPQRHTDTKGARLRRPGVVIFRGKWR